MPAHLQITPRPVFCVSAHAYHDRAVAEAVCAGRFTHVGITLDLGVEPDWLGAALPPDKEWRIAWSKFYYGRDLAAAFADTGDRRFLQTWERLVRSWIQQVPIEADRSDVIGRRVQNWIYAWDTLSTAAAFCGLSDGLDEELLASVAAQVRYLWEHLTPERNHRTFELYTLLIAALALPELDPDGGLRDFAMTELHRNLLTDIRADGVHREASTHYHLIALRTFIGARENARRFGLQFPDGYDARLALACEFALHCHRPDGAIPALSDSDTDSYEDVLELAATLLDRPDFLYSATAGARGIPPAQRYVSFPHGGYFIQRSGWGTGVTPFRQERFLIFDCGPLGDGGHGHYDLLNVEIAAHGQPLIIDPGRYTYDDHPPDWRRWFKATAAHNTVCVDGVDQNPYWRSAPRGPVAAGRFLGRGSAPGFDVLCGEVHSPSYDAVHTRRIFFVGDAYWIIEDQLRGLQPHHYDLRFHLTPAAWEHTEIVTHAGHAVVCAPHLALIMAAPHQPRLEAGWVAPHYGVKLPAPVISTVADGVAEVRFLTCVVPLVAGQPLPTLRVEAHTAQEMRLDILGVGPEHTARDTVVCHTHEPSMVLRAAPDRVTATWLRIAATGERLAMHVCHIAKQPQEGERL